MKRSSPKSLNCRAVPPTAALTRRLWTTLQVVIREWIETAKELGREIPEPKGRLIFA